MSDAPDRLTILEMEYALVSARLNTIDATLQIINARLADLPVAVGEELDKRLAKVDARFDTTDATLAEILRRLP